MAKEMTANNKSQLFLGQVAFICGGSKGIGKETAKEFFRLGGSVCLLARDQKSLEIALIEIENSRSNQEQFIEIISGDATKREEIEPAIEKFIIRHGVPEYLINAVGYAYPEYVQNFYIEDFKENMETNYFGQLVPTLIFLPHFIEQKKEMS